VDRSAGLRLPTIVIPVRLALTGREVCGAELFVADVIRRGRSRLLDDLAALLEGAAGFVPARMDGDVRLIAKDAIVWLAVRRRGGDDQPPTDFPEELSEASTLYDRQHRVAIDLAHGPGVTGLLLDSSPADRPRVVDHLNRPGMFVRVWTPDEHVLVNKRAIVSVTELPAPGEPP
jgi:hypothetical protein